MGLFDPSAALGAAFTAFGVAGVYTPPIPSAPGVPVLVVSRREDAAGQFGVGRALAARGLFEIRAAELADAPVKGGLLTLGGEMWRIESAPEKLDPDRLVWTLRCSPVTA